MRIQVVSRKMIKPSIPTPNHIRNFKLSCIDQLAPAAYGSFIFYYPSNDNNMTISEKEERLDQLERSLSETLTHFYPLAGRYMEDKNSIDCSDQGAKYLTTVVDGELSQFLERKSESLEYLNHLTPFYNEIATFCPVVLAVQVNMFDCGGLAIGVCLSHKVADGFVIFSFIQGWADACRIGRDAVARPNFDMGTHLPEKQTDKFHIPVPENGETKMVTKRFVFSGVTISDLKSKATKRNSNSCIYNSHPAPSRVEIVTALIWKARISAAELKYGHLRPSLLTLAYNFRGKTAIRIPENAFGNAFKVVLVRFRPTESNLDLYSLVRLLKYGISKTTEECSRTMTADDLFASSIGSMREIHETLKKTEEDICVFTSVCRFPYYEIDFGWGKPSWISSVPKPSDIVLMMDTKCGRGIEAWVSLEEKEMFLFEQDDDIVAFTSEV